MRLYNRYLTTLALIFAGTAVLLAFYQQQHLDFYFSIFLIEYLAVTVVFSALNARARRLLGTVGYVLFSGFLGIVAVKVLQLLVAAGAL